MFRGVRLLYLYPSDLTDPLIDAICASPVPYFDLSLQHVSPPLMRRMRRWGDAPRFMERIETIRARRPDAAFRSNFIVGYPGETEADHDALLAFVEESRLDWCGFFAYSEEDGTYGATLDGKVPRGLITQRPGRAERASRPDHRRTSCRADRLGRRGTGRRARARPARLERLRRSTGVITVPEELPVGLFASVRITEAEGPDLVAIAADRADFEEPDVATGPSSAAGHV